MQDLINDILSLAVWAPSGDNSQPWKFELQNNTLRIINVPNKDIPLYNYEQRGSLVAHGALIENISIISPKYGLETEIQILPDPKDSDLVAIIKFFPAQEEESELYSHIQDRRTNRKSYKKKTLTEQQRSYLLSESRPDFRIILEENREKIDLLGPAMSSNEKIVLENQGLHNSFFSGLVWTEEQELREKSGLYVKTMELLPPQLAIFKLYKKWSRAKLLNKLGFSNIIAKENGKLYASSAAIGAIVCKSNSRKDFIETGRLMQRVWLKATKLGLSIHPVTGILFLMQRIIANQPDLLSVREVETIRSEYEKMKSVLGVQDEYVTFMFRIGEGGVPSGNLSRKEPEVVI